MSTVLLRTFVTLQHRESSINITQNRLRKATHCVLDLDSNSTTRLMFLDDVLNFVVDLERRTVPNNQRQFAEEGEGRLHLSERDDVFLLRLRIDSYDTERRSDSERSIDNIATKNDRCR